jgi:hypothetical protein
MISKTTTVYWAPYPNKFGIPSLELLTLEPELVYPNLISERNKNTAFLKCPAMIGFFNNTYLVRSPIDISFKVVDSGTVISKSPKGVVETYLQLSNTASTDIYPNFQLKIHLLCFSKLDVEIQQIPAFMHSNGFTNNAMVISGGFNISKWVRPLSVGFEVQDISKEIVIRRGDPLYYIRFIPAKGGSVKLERVGINEKLLKITGNCLDVKKLVKNNSLKENYRLASNAISNFWKPKKCPWGK